jgi:hypothetical protein
LLDFISVFSTGDETGLIVAYEPEVAPLPFLLRIAAADQ